MGCRTSPRISASSSCTTRRGPLVSDATIDGVIAEARAGAARWPRSRSSTRSRKSAKTDASCAPSSATRLWRAQTPQAFPRAILARAHDAARRDHVAATDDAALCERIGIPVVVVRGSERAIKITDESDFARADALSGLAE